MTQWDYRKINLNDVPRKTEDVDLLNDAGEQGWELVSITANNIAYLKRQVAAIVTAEEASQPARSARRKAPATAK
jgi:hypothetical protein